MNCKCNRIDSIGEVNEFNTNFEFLKFEKELHKYTISGIIEEKSFQRNSYWETVFHCKKCGNEWILVEPDYPFKGYFKKVNSNII